MATRTVIRPYIPGMIQMSNHIARIHASVVQDVYEDARGHAPVDTGALRMSIHIRPIDRVVNILFRRLRSHVVVDTDHWQVMEYGASPHTIHPKEKEALWWIGAPHPVAVVHHPGNEAQPFMRPAAYRRRSLRNRP